MEWIPHYITNAKGIYANRLVPKGSLDKFAEYAIAQGSGIIQTDISLNSVDDDDYSWAGAFGLEGSRVLSYFQNHEGEGVVSNVKMFEIEVENPEGAQFYKQTLAVYLRGSCNVTEYHNPDYIRTITEYIIDHISRLQYDTPTSVPVETDLTGRCTAGTVFLEYKFDYDPPRVGKIGDKMRCGFSPCYYDDELYYGVYFYSEFHFDDSEKLEDEYNMVAISAEVLNDEFGGVFTPEEQDDPNEEPDEPDGPGGGGSSGGDGEHILPDEPVPIPDLPPIGAADVSWLKLFKMTTAQLNDFGAQMTPKAAWQLLQAYFTNPLDAIIGILLIPVDAPTGGARTPAIGDFSWDKAYPIMNSEFYALDCGTITIPPYWDSAFDFGPFTRLQLFLPFIGYRDIDADEVMGGTIRIVYHIDLCTGDCTAFVARSASPSDTYGPRPEQVIAQYNGNCATRVPTGRINHDNAISASLGLLGSAINVGGSIMGAALGQPGNISASQVANQVSGGTMTAVNGFKRQVQRSGNIAAAAGYMGITRPYIIRQIPHQDLPKEYKRLEGYPANKGGTLAQFAGTGLNTVEAMELTGFNGFESEREELLSILRGGVIV